MNADKAVEVLWAIWSHDQRAAGKDRVRRRLQWRRGVAHPGISRLRRCSIGECWCLRRDG